MKSKTHHFPGNYKKILAGTAPIWIFFILITSCSYLGPVQTQSVRETNPLSSMIAIYREPLNHLSAVRANECPMYPSDSEYSLQSIRKHGILTGWIMTVDRLMRSGRDETRLAPKVLINGKVKYYDPVERNDFWWDDKHKLQQRRPNRDASKD